MRRASLIEAIAPEKPISLLATVKTRTAKAPTLPASVGVKNPLISPPMMTAKIATGQTICGVVLRRAFQVAFSLLGPTDGLILHHTRTIKANKKESMSPGIAPAKEKLSYGLLGDQSQHDKHHAWWDKDPDSPHDRHEPSRKLPVIPEPFHFRNRDTRKGCHGAPLDPQIALKSVAPAIVAIAKPPGT